MADYGEAGSTARNGQSRQTTYSEYLELPQLLSLQRPLADPPVHDEMLFVIVHQTHELWFKQMVFELRALVAQIDVRAWLQAELTADRLSLIVGLLIGHVDVLESMPIEEFQRFRGLLGSASGMQSEQFKLIEELSASLSCPAAGHPPMAARAGSGSCSVREALLRSIGAVIPANDGTFISVTSGVTPRGACSIFKEAIWARERRLAERLLHFDEEMVRWRARHMEMARAMIGNALGTGGSTGARYLETTLDKRFFPELWAARLEAAAP